MFVYLFIYFQYLTYIIWLVNKSVWVTQARHNFSLNLSGTGHAFAHTSSNGSWCSIDLPGQPNFLNERNIILKLILQIIIIKRTTLRRACVCFLDFLLLYTDWKPSYVIIRTYTDSQFIMFIYMDWIVPQQCGCVLIECPLSCKQFGACINPWDRQPSPSFACVAHSLLSNTFITYNETRFWCYSRLFRSICISLRGRQCTLWSFN